MCDKEMGKVGVGGEGERGMRREVKWRERRRVQKGGGGKETGMMRKERLRRENRKGEREEELRGIDKDETGVEGGKGEG